MAKTIEDAISTLMTEVGDAYVKSEGSEGDFETYDIEYDNAVSKALQAISELIDEIIGEDELELADGTYEAKVKNLYVVANNKLKDEQRARKQERMGGAE